MMHIRGPQDWVNIINSADDSKALIEAVKYYYYNISVLTRYRNITPLQKLALDLDFNGFKRGIKIWRKAQREEDF